MTQPPVATVIVCTRNPGPGIRHTVSSILASTEPRLTLLLVDQSDDDRVAREIATLAADRRLVHVPCALRGLSRGRNLGVSTATTDLMAFTDDDCVVTPTWLSELIAPFATDPRIGVVFGTVRPAPYDPALGFLPSYRRTTPLLARSIFDKPRVEGIGASMAIRRATWTALHGFDPALGAGAPLCSAEETDFVMRALLAGHFAYETPDAAVIHAGFRSWSQAPLVLRGYLFGIGATLAKLARLGHWQVGWVLARLAVRWTVSRPVVHMGDRAHRRARLFGFLGGVWEGLRRPLDRSLGHFAEAPDRDVRLLRGDQEPAHGTIPATVLDAVIHDRSPAILEPHRGTRDDRVSIVLPNWNALPFLVRALDALVARTTYPYELIVVDNGSTDGSKDYIRDFLRRHQDLDATFIDNAENLFFSTACNQGFQAAAPTSKYLALYCNDVEARSDTWLQNLVAAIQPADTIAAGHAAIKPVTDRYRGVYASYDPVYQHSTLRAQMDRLLDGEGGVMHLYGYCFLLKRELVERTGLYLSTGPFAQYHSDWEWYLRFAAMGYRIAPVDLNVHHWHSISELRTDHPDHYRHVVTSLEDPATVARYLAEGRPLHEGESGFRERYPTGWARLAARVRRGIGTS